MTAAATTSPSSSGDPNGRIETTHTIAGSVERRKPVLWLLLLILLIIAIGGGIVVSKFLFLVLLIAIVVAVFGLVGRSA